MSATQINHITTNWNSFKCFKVHKTWFLAFWHQINGDRWCLNEHKSAQYSWNTSNVGMKEPPHWIGRIGSMYVAVLDPRQSKPLTYPDKLAASIAEGRITYPLRSRDWRCRRGVQARSRDRVIWRGLVKYLAGFGFLQITRDRLGLELSDVISANIKVTIPVILR